MSPSPLSMEDTEKQPEPQCKLVILARENGRQDSKAEVRLSYTVKHHTLIHAHKRTGAHIHTHTK